MLAPLIKTIEVPCSQEKAFTVFLNEMDSWWPKNKFTISAMAGNPATEVRVDSKLGGEIIEVSPDGTEHFWGKITSYDPFNSFSMDFHITTPHEPRGDGSLVAVSFTVINENLTQVALTQTNWEAFGDKARAEGIRGGYEFGWTMIFETAYKDACNQPINA